MKTTISALLLVVSLTFPSLLLADETPAPKTYTVALEPLPPFIYKNYLNQKKQGLSVQLLKHIAKKINAEFKFVEAPYTRLKHGLKKGHYDLTGHMPYKLEVEEFYEYAQDIDWSLEVPMDIYTMDKEKLKDIKNLKIGTPRGNKEFASELTGIPLKNFYDQGSIESLLSMLYRGRIDAYWFPRASTVPFIKKSQKTVYYKKMPSDSIPVCFSVPKTPEGTELKKKIEKAIKEIDMQDLFKDVFEYNKLPDEGSISPEK